MSLPSPIGGDHSAEASITIEGVALDYPQSMTVRVALEIFAMTLREQHDDRTSRGYLQRIAELRALIGRGAK